MGWVGGRLQTVGSDRCILRAGSYCYIAETIVNQLSFN